MKDREACKSHLWQPAACASQPFKPEGCLLDEFVPWEISQVTSSLYFLTRLLILETQESIDSRDLILESFKSQDLRIKTRVTFNLLLGGTVICCELNFIYGLSFIFLFYGYGKVSYWVWNREESFKLRIEYWTMTCTLIWSDQCYINYFSSVLTRVYLHSDNSPL